MRIAKKNFLWYSKGQELNEEDSKHFDDWTKSGLIELEESIEVLDKSNLDISKLNKASKERIEDIAEDLADDGKRNRSNKKSSKKKK